MHKSNDEFLAYGYLLCGISGFSPAELFGSGAMRENLENHIAAINSKKSARK